MAVRVRFESWYISMLSSAKQQREMTKFYVFWRTRTFIFYLRMSQLCKCVQYEHWSKTLRRRARHLVKNEFIFYLRVSQLCKCVQYEYRSKNLLRLNMHRQRPISRENTEN